MIMPGLRGMKYYREHIEQTSGLLNEIRPPYVTFLTVNPKSNSVCTQKLLEEEACGENWSLDPEMVVEQIWKKLSTSWTGDGGKAVVA
jgi:hypothetical protein